MQLDAIKARLHRPYAARIVSQSYPLFCYTIYFLFHLATFPILGLRGWIVAKKRGYWGLIWKRLFGGSKPPYKARWTIVACGGLGEVRVGWTFAEIIAKERDKDVAIIIKSNTQTKLKNITVPIGILPFSNPISVAIFLWRWRPKAVFAVEFFVNYHLVGLCTWLNIPTINFNVPVTEVEAKRINFKRRWRQQLTSASFCQSEIHRERLIDLIGIAPDAAATTGPVCIAVDPVHGLNMNRREVREKYQKIFCLHESDFPIIIAGSTYHPEELIIFEAFDQLRTEFPNAVLIVAPRGVTRKEGCDSALIETGRSFVRRTVPFESIPDSRTILLDVTGELRYLYSVGHMAVVGGSYRKDGTGHTPVEAAAWGLPLTIGPNYPQQKTIVELLQGIDAIEICPDSDTLATAWIQLARDDDRRNQIAVRLEAFLQQSDGAVLDIYDTILGA